MMNNNDNNIKVYTEHNLVFFKELKEIKRVKEELEKKEEIVKNKIIEEFNKYGIVSIDNEHIRINRIAESKTETIDLKKLKEKEPDLYYELLVDYPKLITKKEHIRLVVK